MFLCPSLKLHLLLFFNLTYIILHAWMHLLPYNLQTTSTSSNYDLIRGKKDCWKWKRKEENYNCRSSTNTKLFSLTLISNYYIIWGDRNASCRIMHWRLGPYNSTVWVGGVVSKCLSYTYFVVRIYFTLVILD